MPEEGALKRERTQYSNEHTSSKSLFHSYTPCNFRCVRWSLSLSLQETLLAAAPRQYRCCPNSSSERLLEGGMRGGESCDTPFTYLYHLLYLLRLRIISYSDTPTEFTLVLWRMVIQNLDSWESKRYQLWQRVRQRQLTTSKLGLVLGWSSKSLDELIILSSNGS